MNCSLLMQRFLVENAVTHVFGIPGYANSPFLLAVSAHDALTPILTRHEANAGWMAYGYAQSSGRFGVCTGTSGAGTTNIVSSLTAAYYNSIPILVVTGQVERKKFGKGAFQELTGGGPRSCNVQALFEPLTKYSAVVTEPEALPEILGEAHLAMTTGRPGPVHINLPVDVQKAACPTDWLRLARPQPTTPAPKSLAAVADALDAARAPLLLVGRGCRSAKAAVEELIGELRIPYATTIQGRGLVSEDKHEYLGLIGVAGSPRCNAYVAEVCDLIIAIGTSLGEFTTNAYAESHCKPDRLIHVDVDPREFGKSVPPRLGLVADAEQFCRVLVAYLRANGLRGFGDQSVAGQYLARDLQVPVVRDREVMGVVSPMEIMEIIAECVPDDTIFTADSGNNAVWAAHYLRLRRGQTFLIDINTGCMGSGVVAAIGAKIADPSRPVVAICGDGGFMMNGVDVATAVEHSLPIIWLVMNDAKLGMVAQGHKGQYGRSVACDFKVADVAAMAHAFGCEAIVVESSRELRAALSSLAVQTRPLVIDVRFNDKYLPAVYGRVRGSAEDQLFANAVSPSLGKES